MVMLEVCEGVFRIGQGEFAERLAPLMNLLRRRRFDIFHRLLFGLGAFPQSDASFDEPALLRRPELLNQRVDARLPLIAVVAIDSHIIPHGRNSPLLVVRVLSSAAFGAGRTA